MNTLIHSCNGIQQNAQQMDLSHRKYSSQRNTDKRGQVFRFVIHISLYNKIQNGFFTMFSVSLAQFRKIPAINLVYWLNNKLNCLIHVNIYFIQNDHKQNEYETYDQPFYTLTA